MVRRTVPIARRFRAIRGKLVLAAVWLAAVAGSVVLTFLDDPHGSGLAIVTVTAHPVLAPESGRIASLTVTPGQRVQPGDLLGTIEVPGLSQELAAAEAEVIAAGQTFRSGDADRSRRFARDVESMRASLLATRVDLEAERARLVGFEAELQRLSVPGVAVSASVLDAARAQRDASRATVAAREAEVGGLERYVAAAQARVLDAGDPGSAALQVAEAKRDALRARAETATLRAYAKGTVGPILPAPGQWVQAGIPVVSVLGDSTGELVAYLDVGGAQRLRAGASLSVRPESGHTVNAVIEQIGTSVQQVPLRQQRDPSVAEWGVPIRLRVADVALTPGEIVAVDF